MPKHPRLCSVCDLPIDGIDPPTRRICRKASCIRERNRRKALAHGRARLWGRKRKCLWCRGDFPTSRAHKKFCRDQCAAAFAIIRAKVYLEARLEAIAMGMAREDIGAYARSKVKEFADARENRA
jgi:hypothetical protein